MIDGVVGTLTVQVLSVDRKRPPLQITGATPPGDELGG
jgi:hypothetical protein